MRCLSKVPISKRVILLIWVSVLIVVALLGGKMAGAAGLSFSC